MATLEPLADGFTATGGGRSLDGAVWVEVDTGDVTGWVHVAFIADHRATQEPPSRVVISDGPHVGDLGEVTVDVVGFGDDAVRAARLVIFAIPDDDGASYTLRSVEDATYCARGVTDDELCL